jgi:hypothetical protein
VRVRVRVHVRVHVRVRVRMPRRYACAYRRDEPFASLARQDYGSLPQEPCTMAERQRWSLACTAMLALYASIRGTSVLQARDVPTRAEWPRYEAELVVETDEVDDLARWLARFVHARVTVRGIFVHHHTPMGPHHHTPWDPTTTPHGTPPPYPHGTPPPYPHGTPPPHPPRHPTLVTWQVRGIFVHVCFDSAVAAASCLIELQSAGWRAIPSADEMPYHGRAWVRRASPHRETPRT